MENQTRSASSFRLIWMLLAAFATTVFYINPLRETAIEDDWSYALMVRDLLETGAYQLHDWAAASLPFQAYWGAFFVKLLGFSFTSLRISTIVLTLLGLLAFYKLAKEHDLDCDQAGLLTLGLLSCPLVLLFAFSFMTDVPFLACSLISLFLYTRAIHLRNFSFMFGGSVAACAAIFIRQFGLALPAALFVFWLLQKDRKQKVPFFLVGFILPALAAVIQITTGILSPNWTAELRMHQQTEYLLNRGILLPLHILWRVTVVLQYVALFSLPFLAGVLHTVLRGNNGRKFSYGFLLLFFLSLTGGIVYGRYIEGSSWWMPYLPWYLGALTKGTLRPVMLTLATTLGGALIGTAFVHRYAKDPGWARIPSHQQILDLTTLFFLLLQLFYVQFYDRYLIVFLPMGLIVAGRYSSTWLSNQKLAAALLCFAALSASAMWTRGWLSHEEAVWKGSEFLRKQDIAPTEIFSSWTWNCYFTFGDYLNDIGRSKRPNLDDFFFRWLPKKRKHAHYMVTDTPPPMSQWREVGAIPYRNSFFRPRRIVVLEKILNE